MAGKAKIRGKRSKAAKAIAAPSAHSNVPKPPRGKGRPTDLSPEITEIICDAILDGNYREVAAQIAGISKRTLVRWMTQGRRQPHTPQGDFCRAVMAAESEAESLQVKRVLAASAEDPKHAEWWLERKFPERWSNSRQELNRLRKDISALLSKLGAGGQVAVAESPAPSPDDAHQKKLADPQSETLAPDMAIERINLRSAANA